MANPTSENGGWTISLAGWSTPLQQRIWLIYYLHPNRWLIYTSTSIDLADLLPTSYSRADLHT